MTFAVIKYGLRSRKRGKMRKAGLMKSGAEIHFGREISQPTDWFLMYFCDAASTAATAWTVDESPGN